MTLTQRIGDTATHRIPLRWRGADFDPTGWFLIWTLKADPLADADAQAKIQKATLAGVTFTGSTALVAIVPQDTDGSGETPALAPGTYYWDTQAQKESAPSDVRTVASGTLVLSRDVTRGRTTSIPVVVIEAPFAGDVTVDGGAPDTVYGDNPPLDGGGP